MGLIVRVARDEARALIEDRVMHGLGPRLQALEWSELDRTRRSYGQCAKLFAPLPRYDPAEDPVFLFQSSIQQVCQILTSTHNY